MSVCASVCVSRLDPKSLSVSDLQESSDSSNTTVEDEDVKGKTYNEFLNCLYLGEVDKFWIVA